MEQDLEKAKELVQADMNKRGEEFGEKLKALQEEYNCTLQVGEQGIYIQANM